MKKHLFSLLLALSLLIIPAHAAENNMDNFIRDTETRAYTGQFPDVPQDHTFYNNVAALYEYGLTKGKTDGTFGLTDNVTVSQITIFAGRIRSLYRTGDPEAGPAAYQPETPMATCIPYLTYLKAEGIIGNELDRYLFTPATRAQMAHILANILPDEVLPPINYDVVMEAYATRQYILDVNEYTPFQQDILKLYHCGISHGSDETGSFFPDAPITRGAVAAMLTRIIAPALRIGLEWVTYEVPDISQLTMADLVDPGEYIIAPETDEEMDASIRYMLSRGESQLALDYDEISVIQAYHKMHQALSVMKAYCEQGYNHASCYPSTGGRVLLDFSAVGAGDSAERYRQESLAAAKAIHDHLWGRGIITPDMTELEKARIYYIWVCVNTEYDSSANDASLSHIPYSLFKTGKAVCDGYTGAYNLLLKLEGISCTTYMTETHIWTVAILDGTEYHIDTTWGDSGDSASSLYFAMTPELSMSLHSDLL